MPTINHAIAASTNVSAERALTTIKRLVPLCAGPCPVGPADLWAGRSIAMR